MEKITHEKPTEGKSKALGVMTDNRQGPWAGYICPTCGEPIERDLLVFLRHTDQHILETLKAIHPDWIEADGESPAVLKFYRAQLGHEPW